MTPKTSEGPALASEASENLSGRQARSVQTDITPRARVVKLTRTHARQFRRRAELRALIADRRERRVAIGDAQDLALILADIAVFGRDGCDYPAFEEIAKIVGLTISEPVAMRAIHQVSDVAERKGRGYQPINGETVAGMLKVTGDERHRLDIRTIGAVDETPAERRTRRKASKRRRDRERARTKRAASGAQPRAEYEGKSVNNARPWESEGISRSTWYRRKKGDGPVSPVVRLLRQDSRPTIFFDLSGDELSPWTPIAIAQVHARLVLSPAGLRQLPLPLSDAQLASILLQQNELTAIAKSDSASVASGRKAGRERSEAAAKPTERSEVARPGHHLTLVKGLSPK